MRWQTIALGVPMVSTAFAIAPGKARAQSTSANPAAAQALYDDARRLVDAGDYARACPKFAESYRLDPGGGTLLNLANCYDKQGKMALAWSTFKDALVVAGRDGRGDRVQFAATEIASLESRMPRLNVRVPPAARVPGLTVSVDGAALGEAAWDMAMPIDPGQHVVVAEARGKLPFSASVTVSAVAAARNTVDIPPLADAPAGNGLHADATAGGESPTEASDSGARHTAGWIIAGLGVASIGVGSYFGLRAFSRWSDRNAACVGGCTEAARNAGDEAGQAATIADFGFGAGIVALGVGTYLVLTGRSDGAHHTPTALSVTPGPIRDGAGVWMRGRF